MGTYNLPRDVKGEGRILFVFSRKGLIYTIIGATIGLVFKLITDMLGIGIVGLIIMVLLALIGFVIGTFKMPNASGFKITKKTGGENIDEILKRLIKFKMKKNKVYYYKINKTNTEEGGNKYE